MATTIWYIVASATFLLHITGTIHTAEGAQQQYLGKFLGKLTELHHGVSGEVYAVDGRTLHIKDFTYDGEGPAAYFYAGNSRNPSNQGFRIRDEKGNPAVLRRYRKEPVTIILPEGKTLNNINWFSVWCEEFEVNFGDVKIPRGFDFPRPQKLGKLSGIHGVSSDNVVIVDAQTLLIPNFSYDGEAPDAKFWVGRGSKPSPQGIRVPDENGRQEPLRRYDRKTVVLTLPGELTVFEIGHFGVWCEAFTVDFGHVKVPQNLNVPPSLKMLGVSPQSKLNCEVLHDNLAFEIRWAVAGDSIVMQLVAKLEDREYMSFGVSGDIGHSIMIGGDVTVAWIDQNTMKGYAEDYFLDAKAQCSGPQGSCPDERLGAKSNSIRLLNAAMVNGYSIVTYQRPLKAADDLDRPIFTNQSQAIIWAIGPLNQRDEVSFHSQYTKGDHFIDFGRPPKWNCPMPETSQPSMKASAEPEVAPPVEEYERTTAAPETTRTRNSDRRRGESNNRGSNRGSQRRGSRPTTTTTTERPSTTTPYVNTPKPVPKIKPWFIPPIACYEPEDGVFYAQMGPTGGKHGYPAITGHVGWGICWYINGLLIPEINVVRGKTYTFVVEGGSNPDIPAKYHPFYITDDPVGGFEHKTQQERDNITIFAGAKQLSNGTVVPTGSGRFCNWVNTGDKEADDFESFGAFQRQLELRCDSNPDEPGLVQWTPDHETPDTVYYQCYSHRYLGWKINVLDSCDEVPGESVLEPVIALPSEKDEVVGDLSDSPSQFVETRVKYNDISSSKDTKKISAKIPSKSQYDLKPVSEETDFVPPIVVENATYFSQQTEIHRPVYYSVNPAAASNNFRPSSLDGMKSDEFGFKDSRTETTPTVPTIKVTQTTVQPVENVTPKKVEVLDKTPNNMQIRPVQLPTLKIPQQKPILQGNKIILRRPIPQHIQNRPPFAATPYLSAANRQVPGNMMSNMPSVFKKPVYRPMNKRPVLMGNRHVMMPVFMGSKPKLSQIQIPQTQMPQMQLHQKQVSQMQIAQTQVSQMQIAQTQVPQISMPQVRPQSVVILQPKNKEQTIHVPQPAVQISPLQASTEKEPETIKKSSFGTLLSIKPNYDPYTTMKPAINTGFHPESVIIESGFQPILTKEIEDRMSEDEDGPELEYESEIGVIDVNAAEKAANEEKTVESFGPMFIPSPLDNMQPTTIAKNQTAKYPKRSPYKGKTQVMRIVKHGRSIDVTEDEDEIAMAAEKVESFYLPPNEGRSLNIADDKNGALPPGRVVTYDGRTVSGASLSSPLSDVSKFDTRGSKASEYIRARPQFLPFRGELPPLNPQITSQNLPQFSSRGSINRDLETPISSGSTKLSPVKRERRSAHHTEEHTAQQKAEEALKNQTQSTKSNANTVCLSTALYSIIFLCISTFF